MATFQKREGKTGTRIRVMVRVKGYPTQYKTFKRLTDAKIWARELETTLDKGEFVTTSRDARKYTIRDLVEYYIEYEIPKKSEKTQVTETSFLNWWLKNIGDYSLDKVTPELLERHINILTVEPTYRDGKTKRPPRSKRTVKYYRDILSRAFDTAVRLRWVGKNPFEDVSHIKPANGRIRCLDDKERKDLLYSCKISDNKYLYLIAVFALSTGARKGEIMTLTWKDIDFELGFAILRDTKNGETRSVPVTSYLLELLLEHKKSNKLKNSKWLFPRKDGKAPVDIKKAWVTAVKRSEVENFRFHDLRHSAASYLAMNGATLSEIAAVLGHKTLQMVKRYSHISEQHTSKVVNKMNDKIFNK